MGPYVPDAQTLHLWHLDEDKPPFVDSVARGTPLFGLFNGALPGQSSMLLLGKSMSFHANAGGTPGKSDFKGAILVAPPRLNNGTGDNVPAGFRYFGPDGAFTYEMVVKLDRLPSEAPGIALDLLTMEGDGADRIFSWKIEKEGFLVFVPLPHCGASGGAIATIPTTGPNAPDTHSWFHVAVTYNGNGGVPNNLKLYWTHVEEGITAANCIGSGSLSGDFNGLLGDFAIGNEARAFVDNNEAEPFPGLIDEVRISGVARHPSDFFFVAPELRRSSEQVPTVLPRVESSPQIQRGFIDLLVDSKPTQIPKGKGSVLQLGPGLHRLDFDFGFRADKIDSPAGDSTEKSTVDTKLRRQLEGVDDQWLETDAGMGLICQALDKDGRVVSQCRFPIIGRSDGWKGTLEDSLMSPRVEPVYLPAEARKLRLMLNSGSPETTGFLAIDHVALTIGEDQGPSLLKNGAFVYDAHTTSPAGTPAGWQRGGGDPSIARMILRTEYPGVGLVDADQTKSGEWVLNEDLKPTDKGLRTYSLSWGEAYNVISGSTHRATYVNVPPGDYLFRAIGLAGTGKIIGDELSLSIRIEPPIWQRVWFLPVMAGVGVALIAGLMFVAQRQRSRRSLERLRFQNALEKDRARIARDMHDDLGSRVTFINMSAALAQRDLDQAPDNARRHLARMTESARELIVAMDGLVWAVDPTHDTLDHLASHLTRMAEEMFRDTRIRCRLEIPALLPALSLGSEVRQHIAMAVKESFHNVLCHAGICEVFFSLAFDGEQIRITIRDTGVGFDPSDERGHGLDNLDARFQEIGGTCKISSSPGTGTSIVLTCTVK